MSWTCFVNSFECASGEISLCMAIIKDREIRIVQSFEPPPRLSSFGTAATPSTQKQAEAGTNKKTAVLFTKLPNRNILSKTRVTSGSRPPPSFHVCTHMEGVGELHVGGRQKRAAAPSASPPGRQLSALRPATVPDGRRRRRRGSCCCSSSSRPVASEPAESPESLPRRPRAAPRGPPRGRERVARGPHHHGRARSRRLWRKTTC